MIADKLWPVNALTDLKLQAEVFFRKRFGEESALTVAAPGRVNLIGEHTDYNDGFVLPAAIDRYVVVAAAKSPDVSKAWSEAYTAPALFDVAQERELEGWARYPAGCAWTLRRHGHSPSNLNATIVSNLPEGSGVSSSAAIELAFLTAWNSLDELGLDPLTLALFGQQCEHEFVGVHCGVMDQVASALGRAGHALLLDTRSLEVQYQPIPGDLEIVLCDTNKPRSLDVSAYNLRRQECSEAASDLGAASLRDVTLDQLQGTYPLGTEVKSRRAKHVLTENERCLLFAKALTKGDRTEMGRLMKASHESLRDDFEVSCQELDWMAEAAWASKGCLGARMTGAGFGGACVALVESSSLQEFLKDAEQGYRARSGGLEPFFLVCKPTDGAGVV